MLEDLKWLGWSCLCAVGCSAPLDAPSALGGERFLCSEERQGDFNFELARCRAARDEDASACFGILSLQGTIESQFVVLDAPISLVQYGPQHLAGIEDLNLLIYSEGPFFAVRLDLTSWEPAKDAVAQGGLTPSTYLNLEARGGNFLSNLNNEVYDVELQTAEEIRASVSADLNRNGSIEGCFHLFLPPPPR